MRARIKNPGADEAWLRGFANAVIAYRMLVVSGPGVNADFDVANGYLLEIDAYLNQDANNAWRDGSRP